MNAGSLILIIIGVAIVFFVLGYMYGLLIKNDMIEAAEELQRMIDESKP